MNKLFARFLIIIFCAVLFTGCLIGLEQRRKWITSTPLDEKKWKINDAEMRWKIRPGMARDLIERNMLVGKSCVEIDDLLNMYSQHIDCSKNIVKFGLKQFYSGIIGIDPSAIEYLKITFDNDNKVEKAEIEIHRTGE